MTTQCSLKPLFLISQFPWIKSLGTDQLDPLLRSFTKLKSKLSFHFGNLASSSLPLWLWVEFQFIVVVGAEDTIFGWLLAEACGYLLGLPSQALSKYENLRLQRPAGESTIPVQRQSLVAWSSITECLFLAFAIYQWLVQVLSSTHTSGKALYKGMTH